MPELQVEGVKITYQVCDHCGAVPTEADALKFIRHHEMTCDFCRHKIRVTEAELTVHHKDRHGQGWNGVWGTEPHVSLRPDGQNRRQKVVHEECYRKMFPDGDAVRLAE